MTGKKYTFLSGDYNVNTLHELSCHASATQDFANLFSSDGYHKLIIKPTNIHNYKKADWTQCTEDTEFASRLRPQYLIKPTNIHNYKKADWTQCTEDTEFASKLRPQYPITCTLPIELHKHHSDGRKNHNIPKGKMHSNCRFLPDHIVCKITQRNNIVRANTCDPALNLLNEELTSDIHTNKTYGRNI